MAVICFTLAIMCFVVAVMFDEPEGGCYGDEQD